MEFVDRFQAFVRNVSVVLEKPKPERSKCPRCKGTGLLAQKGFFWDQKPVSNDPCWFCEGIGVMPVAGLSGFLMGRASSMFQTRDIVTRARLPIKTQLYLGKFPGTRPKFVTYKPCENVESLLHDFSAAPEWSSGENYQFLDTGRAEEAPEADERRPLFAREISSRSPMISSARNRKSSSSLRSKSSQSFRVTPRLSRQLGARSSPRSATSSTSAGKVVTPMRTRASDLAAVSLNPRLSRAASKATADSGTCQPANQQLEPLSRPVTVRMAKPLLKSPKAVKAPRRGRNKIREEEERTAAERARRVQGGGGCLPEIEAPSDAPCTEEPPVSSPHSTNQPPFLSWLESSNRPSLSDYSWVNQMVLGRFKQRAPAPPLSPKLFL